MVSKYIVFSSTNKYKISQYDQFAKKYGGGIIPVKPNDDREPIADLDTIACVKATLNSGAFVEDTSLDVEGADFGTDIKYMEHYLDDYSGRSAVFNVAFASVKLEGIVLYRASLKGKIVKNKFPDSVGFNGNFYSYKFRKVLHCLTNDELEVISPRSVVIKKFYTQKPDAVYPHSKGMWLGAWQKGELM